MRLLIITQKVDEEDDVLGFFHGWILEFAKHCESIVVICLYKGKFTLPDNVNILSLGKEKLRFKNYDLGIKNKIIYTLKFYKYIWQERKNYDNVFAHMNQAYVLLGGILWRLWGKKIALWYNHKKGSLSLRLAAWLSNIILYTSPYAFTAQYKKAKRMGVGIDTNKFKSQIAKLKIKDSILYLGRISPVKNIDILVKALQILDAKRVDFITNIYGNPTEKDKNYYEKIKEAANILEKKGKIIFHKAIPNYKAPEIYNQNEIFVNLTPSGSFDKTILEAMACESLVLVANRSLEDVLPEQFLFDENNPIDLAKKIENIFDLTPEEKEKYNKRFRNYVVQYHTLSLLVKKFIIAIQCK